MISSAKEYNVFYKITLQNGNEIFYTSSLKDNSREKSLDEIIVEFFNSAPSAEIIYYFSNGQLTKNHITSIEKIGKGFLEKEAL